MMSDIEREFLEQCFAALPSLDDEDCLLEAEDCDAFEQLVMNGRTDISQRRKALIFGSAVATRITYGEDCSDTNPQSSLGFYLAQIYSQMAFSLIGRVTPDDFEDYPEECWPE